MFILENIKRFSLLVILLGKAFIKMKKMKKSKKFLKGFTLIELLVVIAIIGILASVVLVSFPGASKKANDSRVITAMSQIRTAMAYVKANEGSYTTNNFNCTTVGTDIKALCDDVAAKDYGKVAMTINIRTDASEVCIFAPLNEKNGGTYYCADSTGVAGRTASATPCGTVAASYACPTGMTD